MTGPETPSTNASEFVDTNVLIYAFDLRAAAKRQTALALLRRLWEQRCGCTSLQVLQEFYVSSTKKLALPVDVALAQVQHLSRWRVHRPTADDVVEAIRLQQGCGLSFWHAMIVTSARRLACRVLWSEDMSSGVSYEGVVVRSPFDFTD